MTCLVASCDPKRMGWPMTIAYSEPAGIII